MIIDIKSYKERFDKYEEISVIQNLFNISKERVTELINFGFRFNYEQRHFEAQIEINNFTHIIYIFKINLEKEKLVKYYVRFSDGNSLRFCQEFSLFYDINEEYSKLNYFAIFNHIYTVYRLNQKEEKNTFKQFVENEKESGVVIVLPAPSII